MAGVFTFPNTTTQELIGYWIDSNYSKSPLLAEMKKYGQVKKEGGGQIKFPRITGRFVGTPVVSGATISSMPLSVTPSITTFGLLDWGRWDVPIAISNHDLDRMQGADRGKLLKTAVSCGMRFLHQLLEQRWYTGDLVAEYTNAFLQFGSMNGNVTDGTITGTERGALQFLAPASQTTSYLGMSRTIDGTYGTNNWYNQFIEHNGIEVDFLQAMLTPLQYAESFAQDGYNPLGICSFETWAKIDRAVRLYGSGAVPYVFATDGEAAGKAGLLKPVAGVRNVRFHASRFFQDAALGETEGGFIVDPSTWQYLVNRGRDFQMTAWVNFLLTTGIPAHVAFCQVSLNYFCNYLMSNTAFAKA